jgi:predicted nucleotidyltransferase
VDDGRDGLTPDEQIDAVLVALRRVLGADLVGAYLFGSAVLGGLRPPSDVDVFALSRRAATPEEKRRLIERLLEVSLRPRPLEVTIVVQSDVRPWRYPPPVDFQYGDWWRAEFERGDLEPWSSPNPDLAVLIEKVLRAGRPLVGPPPAEVLDPVPRADLERAMKDAIPALLEDLETDTRNAVLALARIWTTLATGEIRAKDDAAAWALERLPERHRPVLERAQRGYQGAEWESWDDLGPEVAAYAEHVVAVMRRLR